MSDRLIALLEQPASPRVVVVGDVMLDRYIWGDVARVSPEAPIPVLRVDRQDDRLGGAGNVAAMLAALDAEVRLAAVTGADSEGRQVRRLLRDLEVDARAVLSDPRRATTLKQRLLGRSHQRWPQQMMRIDREDDRPVGPALRGRLLDAIRATLSSVDLVLISDYGKGVCEGDLVERVIEAAAQSGVPVMADPAREADYRRYAGCACVTPNRTEASRAAGMRIDTPEQGLEAARRLLRFGTPAAAVTMARDGSAWADQGGNARLFPVRPRQVCDVTGAGDMVLAALGYAFASGADYATAVELANLAGGLEVEHLGVVPLGRLDLLGQLAGGRCNGAAKIVSLDELQRLLALHRQAGRRIAMTNGCFDLLHPGHVASLEAARRQGDCLVVAMNSDRSVRALKGPERPIIDQQGRAEMLAALACVDHVVIFDETSVAGLVQQVRPDVLVKSDQYAPEEIVGHEVLRRSGGRVVGVPMKPPYSTSRLIGRIRRTRGRTP